MKRLALDGLMFDDALWPRVTLDQARVEHLADLLRAGQELPAIKVQKGTSVVLGGRHTVLACRLIGEPTYFVEFVDIEPDERLLFAYREDVAAALPYTNADVRSVARRLYEQRCGTNGGSPNVTTLAAELGRTQSTVARWVEDLVGAREQAIAIKRAARAIAVQAFSAANISTRRVAVFVGVSQMQVRTDNQVVIASHLADPLIVTEAHSLIHLAIGNGASIAEVEAARDWLIAQTNPEELEEREQCRAWRAIATEIEAWSRNVSALTIPPTPATTFQAPILESLTIVEVFLSHLRRRIK